MLTLGFLCGTTLQKTCRGTRRRGGFTQHKWGDQKPGDLGTILPMMNSPEENSRVRFRGKGRTPIARQERTRNVVDFVVGGRGRHFMQAEHKAPNITSNGSRLRNSGGSLRVHV